MVLSTELFNELSNVVFDALVVDPSSIVCHGVSLFR